MESHSLRAKSQWPRRTATAAYDGPIGVTGGNQATLLLLLILHTTVANVYIINDNVNIISRSNLGSVGGMRPNYYYLTFSSAVLSEVLGE